MGFGGKFFNSIFGRKEVGGFTKEDYYEQFYVPRTYKEIRRFISGNGKQSLPSKEPIDFKLIPFGTTLKKAIKALGKPKYILDNKESIEGHEVLFYKYIIGGYKTVAELHFIDKRFFLGQYLFNETDSTKFENVKNLILKKYHISESVDLNSFVLQDASFSKIDVQDIYYGIISYISGNPELISRFDTDPNEQQASDIHEANSTIKQLYENL